MRSVYLTCKLHAKAPGGGGGALGYLGGAYVRYQN